ncbi:hypothetical protein GWK47_042170 [Chionoecetes opilio]|uniref:Uncharacterized protein n=1 Tax=Chionoecetes opilio TaxID=41210 RepID=A0A8J5CWH4_CHIOP|nr:hypothetical protein GWK47_042170 [Chionoecetes opilio]
MAAKTSSPGKKAAELKEKFAPGWCTAHTPLGWKTNAIPHHEGVVDRTAIPGFWRGVEEVLAFPSLTAKAEHTANTIHSVIIRSGLSPIEFERWASTKARIRDQGWKCAFGLQQSLVCDLLHLACRHICWKTVPAGNVFRPSSQHETSPVPDIACLCPFREFWPYVEQDQYRTANEESFKEDWGGRHLKLCRLPTKGTHPRDDDRECVE